MGRSEEPAARVASLKLYCSIQQHKLRSHFQLLPPPVMFLLFTSQVAGAAERLLLHLIWATSSTNQSDAGPVLDCLDWGGSKKCWWVTNCHCFRSHKEDVFLTKKTNPAANKLYHIFYLNLKHLKFLTHLHLSVVGRQLHQCPIIISYIILNGIQP